MATDSRGVSEDPLAEATRWQRFKEWLLPSTSFSKSDTPKKDLLYARVLVGIFYVILSGVAVYTVIRLFYSGRIEMFTNLYKVDFIEAPSLAFCPFKPGHSIQWPTGFKPEGGVVSATKAELKNDTVVARRLDVKMTNCTFDRDCACVDMGHYKLWDVNPENHPAGSLAMVFRENIEIQANVSDPSSEHVLKVGIYDHYDKAPDWFYVNQGAMFIGQLELIVWTVVDISIHGLINTFKGDLRAMVKNRHIFRYTSQQVGDNRPYQSGLPTSVRYEMKTFFVEETMSSHRAFSLYTVGVVIALVALRWVVVDAFMAVMMPEWQETHHGKQVAVMRELSPTAVWIRNLCCCCLTDKDSEPHEEDALMKGKGSQP